MRLLIPLLLLAAVPTAADAATCVSVETSRGVGTGTECVVTPEPSVCHTEQAGFAGERVTVVVCHPDT